MRGSRLDHGEGRATGVGACAVKKLPPSRPDVSIFSGPRQIRPNHLQGVATCLLWRGQILPLSCAHRVPVDRRSTLSFAITQPALGPPDEQRNLWVLELLRVRPEVEAQARAVDIALRAARSAGQGLSS